MALQLGATRDALIEAGASPESAAKAAEELAGYENRLSTIQSDILVLKGMVGFKGQGRVHIDRLREEHRWEPLKALAAILGAAAGILATAVAIAAWLNTYYPQIH
jgi:hypothetical protein